MIDAVMAHLDCLMGLFALCDVLNADFAYVKVISV